MGWIVSLRIHMLKLSSPVPQNVSVFGDKALKKYYVKLRLLKWIVPNPIWLMSL